MNWKIRLGWSKIHGELNRSRDIVVTIVANAQGKGWHMTRNLWHIDPLSKGYAKFRWGNVSRGERENDLIGQLNLWRNS